MPILMLVLGLAYSYWYGYTPPLIGLVYLIASIVSYCLYAKDKKAAQIGMWRVPEKRLHLATLLFGWPGSIIAQQKLRHKTQKLRFRIVFFIMLTLNVGLLSWLHSPVGSQKLHNTIYSVEYWVVNQFGSNAGITLFLKLTRFHIVK
jgi:uncharacterized membrane protein YsdA (DUF1294 family)